MFILRGLFKLVFWVVLAVALFWVATCKVNGKPFYEVARGFFSSGGYKEGVKDLRIFLGGFLKAVGEQIQEEVSDEDRKKLENLIQQQMKGREGEKKNDGYKKM